MGSSILLAWLYHHIICNHHLASQQCHSCNALLHTTKMLTQKIAGNFIETGARHDDALCNTKVLSELNLLGNYILNALILYISIYLSCILYIFTIPLLICLI